MKDDIKQNGFSSWLKQNGHTGYDPDESPTGGQAVNRGIRGHVGRLRGETGAGYSGGVTNPGVSGDVAARAKTAYDFFRSKGLSHEAASGILASMKQESNFTPNARGDGGRAHGLFQHHADRRAAIMRGTGIDMSSASFEKQLEGTWWEMNHGDKGAQRALGILKTPGISAGQAGAAFVQHFERPARDERGSRGALAEGFARQLGGGSVPSSGEGGDVLGRMRALRSSGSVINEQCVALAKAAVGVSGSVTEWRKGVGADAGTLKPGTPVATFLNRDGSQSSRYAGGGTGTMGAGTDHAGVFQGYIRDKAGNITGMRVAEQYKGSGGVKSKEYMFGSGFGEKNASNYNAILGKTGEFLGGAANPMNRVGGAVAEQSRKLQDIGEGMKSSGWRKAGPSPELGAGAGAVGLTAPLRSANTQAIGLGSGSGKGGSSSSNGAVIHINGHNGDPEALANAVQRRINESMSRRSHDVDFNYA